MFIFSSHHTQKTALKKHLTDALDYTDFKSFVVKKMRPMRKILLLLIFGLTGQMLLAQTKNAPAPTLESPFNTMWVHLYYLQKDTYVPELSAMTIPVLPDTATAIRRAIQLKQILDGMGLYVHLEKVPKNPDFIDTTTNKPYYTPFPDELPEVYLEKIDGRWYYSLETVARVPAIHKKVYPFGTDLLLNILPAHIGQKEVFGISLAQYLGALLLFLTLYILYWLLGFLIRPLVRYLSRSRLNPGLIPDTLIRNIARLTSVLIVLQALKYLLPTLLFAPSFMADLVRGVKIILTIVWLLLLLRIFDVVMLYMTHIAEKTTSKLDEQLMPILKKIGQIGLATIAILRILSLLDVNVTALIAGVSIGGLALALAAQDTVKNLIGSAMIFMDQPFQIGDWVEANGIAGTVVEVGFRTTRLQQIDSSIIAVPNGTIANAAVKNLGVRKYRLMNTLIGVTYDTPPELLEKFIEGLKEIILRHPATHKENFYVHFHELAGSSLNIYFRVSLEVTDFAGELKAKETILFSIVRLAQALGISFAFPSTSVYVETFPEKKSNLPAYDTRPEVLNKKLNDFLSTLKTDTP